MYKFGLTGIFIALIFISCSDERFTNPHNLQGLYEDDYAEFVLVQEEDPMTGEPSPKAFSASLEAWANMASRSASCGTMRIPRPPPPMSALTMAQDPDGRRPLHSEPGGRKYKIQSQFFPLANWLDDDLAGGQSFFNAIAQRQFVVDRELAAIAGREP